MWLPSDPPHTVVVLLSGNKIYTQIVEELQKESHVVVIIGNATTATHLGTTKVYIPCDYVLEGTTISRYLNLSLSVS